MFDKNTPKDGDFAAYLNASASRNDPLATQFPAQTPGAPAQQECPERQTIEQVLLQGEEPTDELLEDLRDLREAPALSDEELERQALLAPGADGDPSTPE